MDKLLLQFGSQNGVAGLLAALCVLMTFQMIVKIGVFLWNLKKERDQLSEKTVNKLIEAMNKNTSTIEHLEREVQKLQTTFSEMPKLKLDLRRLYFAAKMIAGDRWAEIRTEIMRDFDQKDM